MFEIFNGKTHSKWAATPTMKSHCGKPGEGGGGSGGEKMFIITVASNDYGQTGSANMTYEELAALWNAGTFPISMVKDCYVDGTGKLNTVNFFEVSYVYMDNDGTFSIQANVVWKLSPDGTLTFFDP